MYSERLRVRRMKKERQPREIRGPLHIFKVNNGPSCGGVSFLPRGAQR